MTAEAVPQVLLCVAGTEILQTGEQCLLSDLRRTCDTRYLFLSFDHASLIEYCCAGNRCLGERCKYAGGSFIGHTAGIQSDLHIVGLDQLTKRDAGVTHFSAMTFVDDDLTQTKESMQLFAEEVLPAFR